MKDDTLTAYLKENCFGRAKTTNSIVLEHTLGVSGNELRKRVNRLRGKGVPIASNREGYYYARDASEVYSTIRQLKVMADGLNRAISGLERALESFGESTDGRG